MNKQDISRMLSQTDEKYLDDVLDDKVKITPRKRPYLGMAAAAAVIVLSVCAVSAFDRSSSGSVGGIPLIISDSVTEGTDPLDALYPAEFGSEVPHPAESLSDDAVDLSGDYGVYFRKDGKETAPREYHSSGHINIYKYNGEYTKKAVKFPTAVNTAANTGVYTDEKGIPVYAEIVLVGFRESDDAMTPYARIQMSADGRFFNRFVLEEPMQRKGVDLYGFECTEDMDDTLDLHFEKAARHTA